MLSLWAPLTAISQTLSLEDCLSAARDNYPAVRQYGMIELARDYTLSNASKAWLPQVSLTGGVSAFTDIINGGSQMAKMGVEMKNYVASGAVSVKQNVYDGGQIAASRQVASAQADVQQRQLDVSLYEVDSRVEQLFFGVLMADEQIVQCQLLQADLETSRSTVASMVKNGTATEADLDAVRVEQLKTQQQQDAFEASREAYLRMLGVFIGRNLNGDVSLVKPTVKVITSTDAWGQRRPEMNLYTSQNALLDAQHRQLNTRLRPTLGLFATGMAHTRVSDLVNNGMLMGGLTLSWNIGALYTRRNDLRKLDVQRSQNENMRQTFLFNNRLQNEESMGNIAALRRQISRDDEIVNLREGIRRVSEKRVLMGTETVNNLVRDINAVGMARQQKTIHEVQLLREVYRQHNINNEK